MKKLFGPALLLLVLISSAFCASSRGSSPTSPSTDSGQAWSSQRATRR